ncbi:MAG: hypothetical protein QXS68_05345 [Candidatus Methanomethylicaceae archaeon]
MVEAQTHFIARNQLSYSITVYLGCIGSAIQVGFRLGRWMLTWLIMLLKRMGYVGRLRGLEVCLGKATLSTQWPSFITFSALAAPAPRYTKGECSFPTSGRGLCTRLVEKDNEKADLVKKPRRLNLELSSNVVKRLFGPLSKPHPLLQSPLASLNRVALELLHQGLKVVVAAPPVRCKVGTKRIGQRPESHQGIFSSPGGLIHKTNGLVARPIHYCIATGLKSLGAASCYLPNGTFAHRKAKYRDQKPLCCGFNVSIYRYQVSDIVNMATLMTKRPLSLLKALTIGQVRALRKTKCLISRPDFRKPHLLMGVKGLKILEGFGPAAAVLEPQPLQHGRIIPPFLAFFRLGPAFGLLLVLFPQRLIYGRGLVRVLGFVPEPSFQLIHLLMKGVQLNCLADLCHRNTHGCVLPVYLGCQYVAHCQRFAQLIKYRTRTKPLTKVFDLHLRPWNEISNWGEVHVWLGYETASEPKVTFPWD